MFSRAFAICRRDSPSFVINEGCSHSSPSAILASRPGPRSPPAVRESEQWSASILTERLGFCHKRVAAMGRHFDSALTRTEACISAANAQKCDQRYWFEPVGRCRVNGGRGDSRYRGRGTEAQGEALL